MKTLLLTMLFALSALAAGETLASSCGSACAPNEMIHFTGTGFAKLNGAKEHYYVCFDHNTQIGYCALLPKATYPVINGVIQFDWAFSSGTHDVCVAYQKNGDPYAELACATITVQ